MLDRGGEGWLFTLLPFLPSQFRTSSKLPGFPLYLQPMLGAVMLRGFNHKCFLQQHSLSRHTSGLAAAEM
eukprot:34658-Rhodomonas_salina.1